MKNGRLMALDIGTKRIGIATCDATRLISTPRVILNRQSNNDDFIKIKKFAKENEAVGIVIGLPIGSPEMMRVIESFAKKLDVFLEKGIPITLFDERLSSFEAKEIHASPLSRKKNKFVDDIAASLILEHFLQSKD
jgi:putative Holliday junction resolvase